MMRKAKKRVRGWWRQRHYVHARARLPVRKDVALFQSFHGRNVSCHPFYLLQELASRGGRALFVATNDVEGARKILRERGIAATPALVGSPEYQRLLATAGLLVNNSTFPQYFIKRPEQIYLNTWHGTPLKTLGKAMPRGLRDFPNVQRNFLSSDVLYYSNEFSRDHILRDYWIDGVYGGRAVVMGSPRNSPLFDDEKRAELRRRYGVERARVLLYLPTWRGDNARQVRVEDYVARVSAQLQTIDEALGDDDVLLVQFHSLIASKVSIGELRHVRPAPPGLETSDLLALGDVLITDYSSVMFDFCATGREIVLFPYDLDEYQSERGFYFPYESLPFRAFRTVEELGAHLVAREKHRRTLEYDEFVRLYASQDARSAAAEVADLIERLTKRADPPIQPEAELVMVDAPHSAKAQEQVMRLLASGYDRENVLFAFPHQAGAKLERVEGFLKTLDAGSVRAKFVPVAGTMQVTIAQLLPFAFDWLFRFRSAAAESVYDEEIRRLFGLTNVTKAVSFTSDRRLRRLAERIDARVSPDS